MSVKATSSVTIADVSDGLEGTGISSTKVEYQAGSSGTSAPTGTWGTSVPSTSASAPYLWTRVTYTYSDGRDPVYVYSVGSTPEGIEVGGRNLLIGSESGIISNPLLDGSTASEFDNETLNENPLYYMSGHRYIKINFPALEAGKQYTFSCDVARPWNNSPQDVFISIGESTSKVGIASLGIWTNFNVTFTASDTSTYALVRVNNASSSGRDDHVGYTRHFKLEKGNKATDWTPAPEDTEAEIQSVKTIAEQTADKFSWLVKSGTSATNFELTDRTATLVANQINLNGLVTFSGLGSDAQNGIINSIEVGGRNLAPNTGNLSASMFGTINPVTFETAEDNEVPSKQCLTATMTSVYADNGIYYASDNYISRVKVGDEVTVSFYAKCSRERQIRFILEFCSGKHKLISLTSEWKKFSSTGTVNHVTGPGLAACFYSTDFEVGDVLYISSIKVERGNKATDWTPAPEDISVENIYTPNTTTIDGGKITTGSIKAEKINVSDLFAQDITATNMTISGDSVFGNFRANTEIGGLTYENSNYGGIMYLGKIAALVDEDEYGFQLGNGNSMTNIQPGGVFVQSNCGGPYPRKTTIHGGFIETYCISTSQSGGTVSIGSDIVPLYSDEGTLLDITLGSSSKKFADLYTSKFNGTSVNSDGIASTSGYGVTKLSSSYTSSSTSIAANSNAVYSLYNKMKTIVARDVATSIFISCTYADNRLRCAKINAIYYSMTMFGGVIEVTNGSTAISYQWVPFFQIPEGFRPSTTIQTVVHVFNKNTSRLSVTYAVEIHTNGDVLINGSFAASESWRFVFPCIMYI